jgi:hypothetical protein
VRYTAAPAICRPVEPPGAGGGGDEVPFARLVAHLPQGAAAAFECASPAESAGRAWFADRDDGCPPPGSIAAIA